MEPSQFDELTKSLATPTSRRQAIRRIAAGALGGLLAIAGIGGTALASKCPPGLTDCGGKCVDTKKDPNNCGTCGTKCQSGLCVNGLCCPVGAVDCHNSCCSFTCCNNVCTNTQSDVNNCGSCGHVCPPGDSCVNGTCVCKSGVVCNGVCCKPGQKCIGGQCVTVCQNNVCTGGACPFISNGCDNNPFCYCYKVPDGTGGCGPSIPCAGAQPCSTCADCPSGSFCAIDTCCGPQGICIPNCGGGGQPTRLLPGPYSAHR